MGAAAPLAGATLLAALLLAIAADPAVQQLGSTDLAGMMASRDLPSERAIAERLVGLATACGRLAGDVGHRDRQPIANSAGNRIAPTRQDRMTRGA